MIPGMVVHLWQSTLFAGAAWLLTLTLRRNSARVRHAVWFTASAKFLVPFSLLVRLGALATRLAAAPPVRTGWVGTAEQIGQPLFTIPAVATRVAAEGARPIGFASIAFAAWACGFAAIAICWLLRWKRVRALVRPATPVNIPNAFGFAVSVMATRDLVEPGIVGVLRPVLLLPEGIGERLDPAQLDAIIVHELCHVRRRDNLTAAIHMAVQATFWFHPLVWWLGARLVDERERACDEEVVRMGSKPEVYAAGILSVCRLYFETPLQCVSGVTGANLKKRIEAIMKDRIVRRLDFTRKAALAAAGAFALSVPVMVGVMGVPTIRAEQLTFDVASVKPSTPLPPGQDLMDINLGGVNHGKVTLTNVTLSECIRFAYGLVGESQISGPDWIRDRSLRVDIAAQAPPNTPREQISGMMQHLLAERFHLVLHTGQKPLAHLELSVTGRGLRLHESSDSGDNHSRLVASGRGLLSYDHLTMGALGMLLSRRLRQPVIDKTGLAGFYDVKLQWDPNDAPAGAELADAPALPDIYTAVREQLGLQLQAKKTPIEIFVVDGADKVPTPN